MEEHRVVDFLAHGCEVTSLKLSQHSNRLLATGDKEAKINIWGDWAAGKPPRNLWTLGNNKSSIEALCFDDQEQNVVSGAMNGSIKVCGVSSTSRHFSKFELCIVIPGIRFKRRSPC